MEQTLDRPLAPARPGAPASLRALYTLHLGTVLDPRWSDRFPETEIIARDDGSGVLIARVLDQAMLFGILLQIRDLGIPLLGVYPGDQWPPAPLPEGEPEMNRSKALLSTPAGGDHV